MSITATRNKNKMGLTCKIFKNNRAWLTVGILCLALFVFISHVQITNAGGVFIQGTGGPIKNLTAGGGFSLIDWAGGQAKKLIVDLVTSVVLPFLQWIIGFEISWITWAINPATWGGFITNSMVQTGWKIILNFVDMGFVLAIVAIAIGFILRIQSYGSTKVLGKLIIAAILVNFSLVIAGIFIDSANIITNFLINGNGGIATFTKNLSGTFQNAFLIQNLKADTLTVGLLFAVLFEVVEVIVMGAFFVMLIIRVFFLWLLLILAPAAWLMWVFPGMESHFREWWHNFIKWTYFAPIALFFVLLALTLVAYTNNPNSDANAFTHSLIAANSTVATGAPSGPLDLVNNPGDFASIIIRYILFMGLMIGSLMMANKLGIATAGAAQKLAMNVATAPGKWGKAVAKEYGQRKQAQYLESVGRRLQKLPGMQYLGQSLIQQSIRARQETDKFKKQMSDLLANSANETVLSMAQRGFRPEERMAGIEEAIKRGIFGELKFSPEKLSGIAKEADARRYFDTRDKIMSTKPDHFINNDLGLTGLDKDKARREEQIWKKINLDALFDNYPDIEKNGGLWKSLLDHRPNAVLKFVREQDPGKFNEIAVTLNKIFEQDKRAYGKNRKYGDVEKSMIKNSPAMARYLKAARSASMPEPEEREMSDYSQGGGRG